MQPHVSLGEAATGADLASFLGLPRPQFVITGRCVKNILHNQTGGGKGLGMMVFMGRGLSSGGQESGSVFSATVCKIQASKRYIKSPLVPKDKRSCFSQGERSAVQLPLDHAFALRK